MDGIHDLGGRQGFGPVDRTGEDEGFHAAWEARMFGIVRGMARPKDWSIDWFRHCRELIDPVDYLTRPYYDQWLQSYAAMLVTSEVATVAELASGHATGSAPADLTPVMVPEQVAAALGQGPRFDQPGEAAPAFDVGARIRTLAKGIATHTRLPAYARGASGTVTHFRGHHVLPDANAIGDKRAEPLYTVAFAVSELWPEVSGSRDVVHLDLWESYLEAA